MPAWPPPRSPSRDSLFGITTGITAWGMSYAVLGKLGIYRPITEYDRATLWKDLSAHLVFGTTIGAVLTVAHGRRRD